MDINELTGRYARQIEVQLSRGDFERAHAIVDEYEQVSQPQAELSLAEKRELAVADAFDLRIANPLERLGILTVADLSMTSPERLLATRHFGPTSLSQIRATLEELGFQEGAIHNDFTPPPQAKRRRRSTPQASLIPLEPRSCVTRNPRKSFSSQSYTSVLLSHFFDWIPTMVFLTRNGKLLTQSGKLLLASDTSYNEFLKCCCGPKKLPNLTANYTIEFQYNEEERRSFDFEKELEHIGSDTWYGEMIEVAQGWPITFTIVWVVGADTAEATATADTDVGFFTWTGTMIVIEEPDGSYSFNLDEWFGPRDPTGTAEGGWTPGT